MAIQKKDKDTGVSLENVISAAIQIPGVKVNREAFLCEQFKKQDKKVINRIVEVGPVKAKIDRRTLRKMARRIVNDRTWFSSVASFATGIPGGLTMAVTIPADMLQFYGVALRMAQELAYLYGEEDLWNGEIVDNQKVANQLILYCGVMLGASGATQTIRVLSSALANQIVKKLPQKALTKTFYYPVVKNICKFFGIAMTKKIFAISVAKFIPIIGGVLSAIITMCTLRPMGQRLFDALDEACFSYTQEEINDDLQGIVEISVDALVENQDGLEGSILAENVMNEIAKAKTLLDCGVLTEDEFSELKAKLIARL